MPLERFTCALKCSLYSKNSTTPNNSYFRLVISSVPSMSLIVVVFLYPFGGSTQCFDSNCHLRVFRQYRLCFSDSSHTHMRQRDSSLTLAALSRVYHVSSGNAPVEHTNIYMRASVALTTRERQRERNTLTKWYEFASPK